MYATTATALLADSGWHPWFLFIPFFWLAFLVIVFAVLRRTVWRRAGCFGPYAYHHAGQQGPLAVLGERYARGEIDEDEYRARKAVITEQPERDR
ncbi:SHOCT domain-containing protein [Kitasatospora azatica]|uniref:SHOCT domain-containing protein n=1 Tax=Kitasatospora azatica TaxID=58347 RepID=UPI00056AB2E3|nr:SHOCT domain-containing protein [Kitasatospora azatica]